MKTPSMMSQLQKRAGDVEALNRSRAASMRPKKPLPASPMKILAGGKFQKRKPQTAAANRLCMAQRPVFIGINGSSYKISRLNSLNKKLFF
jgi:hypothetical protein